MSDGRVSEIIYQTEKMMEDIISRIGKNKAHENSCPLLSRYIEECKNAPTYDTSKLSPLQGVQQKP